MAKKLIRRKDRDRSQWLRRGVQLAFLALNVWIGVQFYLFVRYYETGGGRYVSRPPGVEGWLPIASLMNLKVLLATGEISRLHPAGMFLLIAFLAASWIFRKSFCSWLCPVGAISEWLWKLGHRTFGRNFQLPRKLDVALRSIKYLLLGLFLYAVGSMSVAAIRAFLEGPYGIVDDVKMLNFFRYLGLGGGIVMALLVLGSVLVRNFWCRYLCPYGALMGMAALPSPLRIRRDPAACIDCAKCAKACPSSLPVDKLITIASAECTGCLECVAECPAAGALWMAAPRGRRVPAWAVAAGTLVLFFGVVGYAQWRGYWRTDIPGQVYSALIPHANEFSHP
ncbi:MAG TPA: 4Fe-4S binding protein [Candidatus Acidoferrales bacterium]|nr:4Fe-4S binding protein [Candidatus Acidoferrales bacterium]